MRVKTLLPILAILVVCASACSQSRSQPRPPGSVGADVGRLTLKVQGHREEPAMQCHRATTAAAIAVANVTGPLARGETVPRERYVELEAADQAMLKTCAQFN